MGSSINHGNRGIRLRLALAGMLIACGIAFADVPTADAAIKFGPREKVARGSLAPPQVVLTGKGATVTTSRFKPGRCCEPTPYYDRARVARSVRGSSRWSRLTNIEPWFEHEDYEYRPWEIAGIGAGVSYSFSSPRYWPQLLRLNVNGRVQEFKVHTSFADQDIYAPTIARSRNGKVSMVAQIAGARTLRVYLAGRPAVRRKGHVKVMDVYTGGVPGVNRLSDETYLWGAVASDGRIGILWSEFWPDDEDQVAVWSVWRDRKGNWSKPEAISPLVLTPEGQLNDIHGLAVAFDEAGTGKSEASAYVAWRESVWREDEEGVERLNDTDDYVRLRTRSTDGVWSETNDLNPPELPGGDWHDPFFGPDSNDHPWLDPSIRLDVKGGRFAIAWSQKHFTLAGGSRQTLVASGSGGNVNSLADIGMPVSSDFLGTGSWHTVPVVMPKNRILVLSSGFGRYQGVTVREMIGGQPVGAWRTIGGRVYKRPKWDARFGYAVRAGRLSVVWGDRVKRNHTVLYHREIS